MRTVRASWRYESRRACRGNSYISARLGARSRYGRMKKHARMRKSFGAFKGERTDPFAGMKKAEPADEADRGRHPGVARHVGLAGGPGSLSLSLGGRSTYAGDGILEGAGR